MAGLKWSDKEIDLVKKLYCTKITAIEISKLIDRTPEAIRAKAERIGVSGVNRLSYNKNYFSKFTEESCYWAGFIAADGCIYEPRKSLSVGLANKDIEHLEKLKTSLEYEGKTSKIGSNNSVKFAIYNADQLIKDLKTKYNIVPNKTNKLKPPDIKSTKFKEAFIVGYIDGDGSIFEWLDKSTKKPVYRPIISIVGTKEILTWIKTYFNEKFKVNKLAKITKRGKNFYSYRVGGNRAKNIILHLNKVNAPKLERKWKVADKYA